MSTTTEYDAILLVSFGGPEKPADVIPFLENVVRGRRVPRERLLEVAQHYYHFGGKSPINDQNRRLLADLDSELAANGLRLPIYWGNMHWNPMLPETIEQMRRAGVRRALAFVTSAYSSYSGCRQYREHIEAARRTVGPEAPIVDKLRVYFNHPDFISASVENVRAALNKFPAGERHETALLFTAHSIPLAMAETSKYLDQLRETSRLVSIGVGHGEAQLVFQSRSGPPSVPWLEPDVVDYLRKLAAAGQTRNVVVAPIGFTSDHMEVLYDLDTEARQTCEEVGLRMVRAATVGSHPAFVRMIRKLIVERVDRSAERQALGTLGPGHDECPADCCPAPVMRSPVAEAAGPPMRDRSVG